MRECLAEGSSDTKSYIYAYEALSVFGFVLRISYSVLVPIEWCLEQQRIPHLHYIRMYCC